MGARACEPPLAASSTSIADEHVTEPRPAGVGDNDLRTELLACLPADHPWGYLRRKPIDAIQELITGPLGADLHRDVIPTVTEQARKARAARRGLSWESLIPDIKETATRNRRASSATAAVKSKSPLFLLRISLTEYKRSGRWNTNWDPSLERRTLDIPTAMFEDLRLHETWDPYVSLPLARPCDQEWREVVARRCNDERRRWERPVYGPPPGDPGCRVPNHILAEFGLAPAPEPLSRDAGATHAVGA